MSYSAFKLQVAAADGKSIRNTITQGSHGFVSGNVLRYVFSPESQQGFTLAVADTPENAEVVGVVESVVDDSQFVLVYSGELDLSTLSFVDTDGVYFLSPTTRGQLTTEPPTSGGAVIKPVLTRIDDDTAIVTNYLGTVIGGQSTVSLDEVQPAGVIAPYIGGTETIPNNWGLCDGSFYDRYKYPDLYQKVGKKYGFRQDLIIESTVNSVSITLDETLVGGKVVATREVDGSTIQIEGSIVSASDGDKKISVNVDSYTQSGVGAGDQSVQYPADAVYEFSVNDQVAIFDQTGSRVFQLAVPQVTQSNVTHLQVPDLRGRSILGSTDSFTNAVTLTYPLGQVGGDEETSMFASNLPPHAHALSDANIIAQTNVSLLGDVRLPEEIPLKINTGLRTEDHHHYIASGSGESPSATATTGIWRPANRNRTIKAQDGEGAGTDGNNVNFEYSLSATDDPAIAGKSSVEDPRVVGNLRIQDRTLTNSLSIQNGGINAEIQGNTNTVGGGQPVGNLQPYMALHWIIRLTAYQKAALVDLDISTVTTFSSPVSFNGGLTGTAIDISGKSGFSGGATFGAEGVDIVGRLDVAGGITSSTLNITGYAEFDSGVTLDGRLDVIGASTFTGEVSGVDLTMSGVSTLAGLTSSSLDVTGVADFAGGVTASSLDVTGVADFAGGVTASSLDVIGRVDFAVGVTIDGRLDLAGVGDFAGGITASVADVTGPLRANAGLTASALDVTGVSDFAGGVTADTLDVSGISRLTALTMKGTGVSILKGTTAETLDVSGEARFAANPLISTSDAPAAAGSSGKVGEIAWDSTHLYICVAANTWKRVAISTWS